MSRSFRLSHSVRGQVTIFIILGLIILAAAGFLFSIASQTNRQQLFQEQERILSESFGRESLRLFVEDCLEDSLVEGIILLGSQGRIWDDQSGGRIPFIEGENGVSVNGKRVFYGLSFEETQPFTESYPCQANLSESPEFCRFDNESLEDVQFGEKEGISLQNIERDLASYLRVESVECVDQYVNENLSASGRVIREDIELSVDIETDGINVDVQYPLELRTDGETYFQLSEFNFFYPSEFKTFLSRAVTIPLSRESRVVGYELTEETLLESSLYRELSARLVIEELETGDTLFEFMLPDNVVLRNIAESFFFSFVIQNRPPALHYVERNACSAYDYLVIPGYENHLGQIQIDLGASDPDGDSISYEFSADQELLDAGFGFLGTEQLGLSSFESVPPGIYNLTVTARDQHNASDEQTTRILVDRPIDLTIGLETPYANSSSLPVQVSTEDPSFLSFSVPSESLDAAARSSLSLSYSNMEATEQLSARSITFVGSPFQCFSFPDPNGHRNCELSDYGVFEIENWKSEFPEGDEESLFTKVSSLGEFSLEYSAQYCSEISGSSEQENLPVIVNECLYYQNPEHPFSYPYHETRIDPDNGDYLTPETINPFLATHSCCDAKNTYAQAGTVCYESEPGCYGAIEGWTSLAPGYILEEQIDVCSGQRGNVCGAVDGSSTLASQLYQGELRCGSSTNPSCVAVASECQGELAWSYIDSPEGGGPGGWCHGDMGCSAYCSEAVVYLGPEGTEPQIEDPLVLNQLALSRGDVISDQSGGSFSFTCGCVGIEDGTACDPDFDGDFEGICSGEICGIASSSSASSSD